MLKFWNIFWLTINIHPHEACTISCWKSTLLTITFLSIVFMSSLLLRELPHISLCARVMFDRKQEKYWNTRMTIFVDDVTSSVNPLFVTSKTRIYPRFSSRGWLNMAASLGSPYLILWGTCNDLLCDLKMSIKSRLNQRFPAEIDSGLAFRHVLFSTSKHSGLTS